MGAPPRLSQPLLDIPLNYDDDLAARFDFDDEFLSELAYYNVLYDRDAEGGELFHVYTEPFEGRFFFEILQRCNGYAGYGTANVAVRLAAMAEAPGEPAHRHEPIGARPQGRALRLATERSPTDRRQDACRSRGAACWSRCHAWHRPSRRSPRRRGSFLAPGAG